jgi:hypothetical protein
MDCRQRLEGEVIRREGTSSNHTKPKAFLLCYVPSPLFPAHWSLWIPYDGKSGRGTRIHVTGDALNGFQHDFDRGYDPRTDDRHPRLIQLGVVDASSLPQLAERVGPCLEGIDTRVLRACSAVEELSMAIPAPGPSLRSSGSAMVCWPCFFDIYGMDPVQALILLRHTLEFRFRTASRGSDSWWIA